MARTGFEKHARATRKAEFLAEMEQLMPWVEWCALIEPHYLNPTAGSAEPFLDPKAGNGRPPIGLERMLRMYCVANGFNLADEACEEALYDIALFRDFCGFDLDDESIADATTLANFRHLLEAHGLGMVIFAKVGELLQANGLRLSGGTIVDATLIAAPPSTKNQDKTRAPAQIRVQKMHQVKKGNQWHFLNPFLDGMKLPIGVDSASGLIHSASVTAANVHDSHEVPNLLHGEETRFYGDSAYRGKEQRERLKAIAPKAKDFTNRRAYRNAPLTEADRETNRRKSSVRSKVEHPFLTLKRHWGFAKTRYRGLAKNAHRTFVQKRLCTSCGRIQIVRLDQRTPFHPRHQLLHLVKWGRSLTGELRPI
jgi:IS5 family transposase